MTSVFGFSPASAIIEWLKLKCRLSPTTIESSRCSRLSAVLICIDRSCSAFMVNTGSGGLARSGGADRSAWPSSSGTFSTDSTS